MADSTDDLIEALVRAREAGMTRAATADLVADVYSAPWSRDHEHVSAPAVCRLKSAVLEESRVVS